MAGSQTDITAQKEFEEKLHTAAYHDSLTGLPNRLLLTEKLKQILNLPTQESPNTFAVLFLDLDRFKLINDSFGHMKGDQLLLNVSNLLKEWTRPGDFISRFGGDEFIIVMQNVDNPALIISEIQHLHHKLNEPFEIDGKQVYVGVSIGVAIGPDGYQNPDEIIRDADIALYQAKNLGLSHYVIFDPGMRNLAVDSLSIETDLRQALEKNQFVLFYQPIINLESMSLSGFEALIRWQHPTQGLIMPGDFVTIAEHSGLINNIGKWVLDESLRQLAVWQEIQPSLTMSINISAQQINDETLVESVRTALNLHQITPAKFALEITETSVLQFDENTIRKLHAMKETGVKLYLDDFGTGYSSLNVLHKYPIDVIKIDQSFIREILQDRNKIEIAHTIVQLGSSLGMDVIAEGIENNEALQLLKSFQCPFGQGYYFHKPMPVQLVNKMLAEKDTYWKSVAHQPVLK
jgi:diguanylate cyclase (GGDEF)-like protein